VSSGDVCRDAGLRIPKYTLDLSAAINNSWHKTRRKTANRDDSRFMCDPDDIPPPPPCPPFHTRTRTTTLMPLLQANRWRDAVAVAVSETQRVSLYGLGVEEMLHALETVVVSFEQVRHKWMLLFTGYGIWKDRK
jgi:hypothetical protein